MPAPCHLVVKIYRGLFSVHFLLEMAGGRHKELRWVCKKDRSIFSGTYYTSSTVSFNGRASCISCG